MVFVFASSDSPAPSTSSLVSDFGPVGLDYSRANSMNGELNTNVTPNPRSSLSSRQHLIIAIDCELGDILAFRLLAQGGIAATLLTPRTRQEDELLIDIGQVHNV